MSDACASLPVRGRWSVIGSQSGWTVASAGAQGRRPDDARRGAGAAVAAGLLSLLVPGLGHLWAGRTRRGLWWLTATVTLALAGWGAAARVGDALFEVLIDPRALKWLLAANGAAALFRLAAVLDASWLALRGGRSHGRRWGRSAAVAAATLMTLALALAPHALAGFYGWQAHRVLTGVFGAASIAASEPSPTVAPAASLTPTAAPPATAPSSVPLNPGNPAPTRPTATHPPDADAPGDPATSDWGHGDRLTVALLGTDAGPGRRGARSDSMLVVSVNLVDGQAAVFSAPRNLEGFPLPPPLAELRARHCPSTAGWQQLSALYRCLDGNRERVAALYPEAPDPAAAGVAHTLSMLAGIRVDHYAVVNMAGFVGVIDALGGATVEVARPVRTRLSPAIEGEDWQTFDIPVGTHHLDGRQALAFVRSRTGSDDYDRMARQRCLVASVAAETDAMTLLGAFPALADALVEHVATDIPVDRLPQLLRLRDVLDLDQLVAVGFGPPLYQRADKTPDLEQIRGVVARALLDPEALRDEGAAVGGVSETCR